MKYRIREWSKLFENNRTRELKKLDWVPVPNRMDGDKYSELVDHPNGAAHFGAWIAILEIASRCDPRGTLPQEGAGCPASLGRMSRLPAGIFQEVLPRLVKMGWIEQIQQDGEIPQDNAEIPQDDAGECLRGREKGIEGKGREGKGTEASAPVLDDFGAFLEMATLAEMRGSETDLRAAKIEWGRLDFEQKIAACAGIRERVAAGELADPGFRPLPQNYLKNRIWQRRVREKREPGFEREHAKRNEVRNLTQIFRSVAK